VLALVNPFHRDRMPPHSAPAILDRLNEITFNASVVLEVNAIEAINSLLRDLQAQGVSYSGRYRPIRLHSISNDAFLEPLGFMSKSSTSWELLSRLHDVGYQTAEAWVSANLGAVGQFDYRYAITDAGLKLPRDASVIGFNNQDLCAMTTPTLTSVDQNIADTVATSGNISATIAAEHRFHAHPALSTGCTKGQRMSR